MCVKIHFPHKMRCGQVPFLKQDNLSIAYRCSFIYNIPKTDKTATGTCLEQLFSIFMASNSLPHHLTIDKSGTYQMSTVCDHGH